MQILLLRNRPRLKRRRVTHNARKIAIMQPSFHSRLTRYTCEADIFVRPCRRGKAHFRAQFVVTLYKAGANEKEVADADVAALGFWAEI